MSDNIFKKSVPTWYGLFSFLREAMRYHYEKPKIYLSIDKLKKAENKLNRQMRDDIYMNEFYYEIGLKGTSIGDDLGWNIDNGYINLDFSSQLADDGTPCLVVNYHVEPRYDYRGLM